MPKFILKPIFWNTERYQRPSGAMANSGFPKKNGFGQEEWNNSKALIFVEDGVVYRIFHTEKVGNATLQDGDNFIFMYSSHNKVQDLVGVAGSVTCLMGNEQRRSSLAETMNLDALGEEAWSLQKVRSCFGGQREAFDQVWSDNLHWIPNWICANDMFLWLNEPLTLDPSRINGKNRLPTRYNQFSYVTPEQAQALMALIPDADRSAVWSRISAAIQFPVPETEEADIQQILTRTDIRKTTRFALAEARRGQGQFRIELEQRWSSSCAVTSCAIREVLRASHIKPWRASNDKERLDSCNGLLLTAHLDALFDRGLISFTDLGEMLVSGRVPNGERKRFCLPMSLRQRPTEGERGYLLYHRRNFGFSV